MRCLVLGGNGFLGTILCKNLLSQGIKVRVFDRPVKDQSVIPANIEWYEGDFSNEQDVDAAVKGCDIVFHLISTTLPKSSNDNPAYDVESNIVGTIKMLLSSVKYGVQKVIFTSSGGTVYGIPKINMIDELHATNPICAYGISKLAIEKYLHLFYKMHGLQYSVLRISNLYGEGQRTNILQGAVGVFISKALSKETIEVWGDGETVRDYVHVSDVSNACIKAMLYNGDHHVFNISSGIGTSLNTLLESIEKVTTKKPHRVYLEERKVDVPINILSNTLAKKELGWNAGISLDEGIKGIIDSYMEQNEF